MRRGLEGRQPAEGVTRPSGAVTTGPVEALALVQPADAGTAQGAGQGIDVYGAPMHLTAAELAERLAAEGLDAFMAREARHGVGNYVTVWREGGRITVITGPGYVGGYIRLGARHLAVATEMATALGLTPDPVEADPFGMSFYLSHAPSSNFNTLPFTTMFRGLRRLPPGSLAVLEKARLARFQTYLNLPGRLAPPHSFRAALDEAAASIAADMARRPEREITVMFSGGVDCLAIWLAVRRLIDPARIRLVTMEHNVSNGPDRALPVARALGTRTEIVPGSAADAPAVQACVRDWLGRDTAGLHPHRLLAGLRDNLILHGQNMDALVNGHMTVLQKFHEAGLYSAAADSILKSGTEILQRDQAFARNVMLTDAYLADPAFQKISAPHMAAQFEDAIADPDPGPEGVLRGLISYQMPNILSDMNLPIPQAIILNAELALFRDYLGTGEAGPRMQMDLMRFLTYSAAVAKRFMGHAVGPGTDLCLPANSGPLLSYFLGRPRGLYEANQPKREIYAYVRQVTGQPYRSLIRPQDGDKDDWSPAPGMPVMQTEVFAQAARTVAEADRALFLEGVDDHAIRLGLGGILAGLQGHAQRFLAGEKATFAAPGDKVRLIRVANLIWIAQAAQAAAAQRQGVGAASP